MKLRFTMRLLCGLTFLLITAPIIVVCNSSDAYASAIITNNEEDKQEVKLNVKSTTIVKGKTYPLKVYNLTPSQKVSFKSSDSDIASVDENGVISANKVGNANITVTVKEGSKVTTLTCSVTVGPTALSVKFTKSKVILGLDKSDLLNVILKPINTAESARFSSRDNSIAAVSVRGRVSGKSLGMTYVFAEIGDKSDSSYKYSTCTVIVVKPEDVTSLEKFFEEHPELNLISDFELMNALEGFFNKYAYSEPVRKARIMEDPSTQSQNDTSNDTNTGEVDNSVSSSTDAKNSNSEESTNSNTTDTQDDANKTDFTYVMDASLTENLEHYLDNIFQLSELKSSIENK